MPAYLQNRRWLIEAARNGKGPRTPHLTINNILGVTRACQRGLGVAMLPDYIVEENGGLVQLFGEAETIALDAYFVYPEELKTVARVQVFRDFLVAKAQRWKPSRAFASIFPDAIRRMAGMRRCVVPRPAHSHSATLLQAAVRSSSQNCNRCGSCSPLEGDCRPSRADKTQPGSSRARLFFDGRDGR